MVIKKCHIAFHFNSNKYFVNKEPIQCTAGDCYSPIYAISRYLSWNMPSILPPLYDVTHHQIKKHERYCFKPMFHAWNIYLSKIFTESPNSVFRDHQNLYISILLDEDPNLPEIQSNIWLYEQSTLEPQQMLDKRLALQKMFSIHIPNIKKLKVGLYLTQPIRQDQMYSARLDKTAVLLGVFFDNQEWKVFDIPNGIVPTVEELLQYDAVVITGSSLSVLYKPPEIQKSIDVLGQAYKKSNKLKIIGVCFGHQLTLQYFGAEVVRKKLISKIEQIRFDSDVIQKHHYLAPLSQAKTLRIMQYHEDFVETVPSNFELIAKSESCKVESTISKDGRIFTSQFHSQLLFPFMNTFKKQLQSHGINLDCKLDYTEDEVAAHVEHSEIVLKIIGTFLRK